MRQRGGARPRHRTPPVAAAAIAVVVLAGCSGDDSEDAADDTEVAGTVLERDQDGRPAPAEDADDTDVPPAVAADPDELVTDHLDTPEAAEGDDGAGAPAATSADQATANSSSRPSTSSPGPAPAPQPPPSPQPRTLSAGLASPGIALGFGDDDTETSSVTLERDQPPLVSDAVRIGDDDWVACATRLHAPDDRALTAKGTLRVGLVIDDRDGSVRRVPRQLVELDVHVVAGSVHELPVSRAYSFDRATLRGIACEAVFQPE